MSSFEKSTASVSNSSSMPKNYLLAHSGNDNDVMMGQASSNAVASNNRVANNTVNQQITSDEFVQNNQFLMEENAKLREKICELSTLNVQLQQSHGGSYQDNLMQLQADVQLLEESLLQKSKKKEVEMRKKEINLRAELQVKEHEITSLQEILQTKERMILAHRNEMDAIHGELRWLKNP